MQYSEEQKFFQIILKVYVWLVAHAFGIDLTPKGELKIMSHFIVKDDNPAVGLKLTLGEVKDGEGNVITDPAVLATLTKEVVSTNENAVAFIPSTDGTKEGDVVFGSPGDAALQYSVKDASGNVLGTGGDTFTVTTGDPKSIASVTASLDDLTPADEPAPTTEVPAPAEAPVEATPAQPEAPVEDVPAAPVPESPADTALPADAPEEPIVPNDGGFGE